MHDGCVFRPKSTVFRTDPDPSEISHQLRALDSGSNRIPQQREVRPECAAKEENAADLHGALLKDLHLRPGGGSQCFVNQSRIGVPVVLVVSKNVKHGCFGVATSSPLDTSRPQVDVSGKNHNIRIMAIRLVRSELEVQITQNVQSHCRFQGAELDVYGT